MDIGLLIVTINAIVTGINCNWTFELHKDLFRVYNKDVIPKLNDTEPAEVTLTLVFYSIEEVNEKFQKISFRAVLDIQWRDEFLRWDPEKYGGVKTINVPVEKVWVPKIVLQDTYGSVEKSTRIEGTAIVKYTGHVIVWPYDLYTVACKIFVAKFPFDKQTCLLDFLPWTNPASSVRLYSSYKYTDWKPEDHAVLEKGEWQLQNVAIKNESKIFRGEAWDHVIFSLELQRKPLFHIINTVIPVILISALDVFCFILPSESGERVALSVSVFLTLTVFLSAVNSSFPESSDEVSLFNVFIGMQILGSALSVIMTNISLYFYYKITQYPVPAVMHYVAKLCFLKAKSSEGERIDITWQMVSQALDRLCLCCAVPWHLILIVCFINIA